MFDYYKGMIRLRALKQNVNGYEIKISYKGSRLIKKKTCKTT